MIAQILVEFNICRLCFFFQKVFRKPKFNFVSKIELHNPVVGGCQSTLKVSGVANLTS